MWQPTPRTTDVTVTKIADHFVRVRVLMNRRFVFVFLAFIFLRYGHFVEYMNMHAINMWVTDSSGGGLDFAPMASQQRWGCHCESGATQLK